MYELETYELENQQQSTSGARGGLGSEGGRGWGEGVAACRLLIIIAVHRAGKEPVQRVIRLQKDKTSERDSHCNGTLQKDLNIGE